MRAARESRLPSRPGRVSPGASRGLTRPDQSVLGLQRKAGNRAVCALLQRAPVGSAATGTATTGIRFTVGTEVTVGFALAATSAVADGQVDDRDLEAIRQAALVADASVSDDERMFMAGLLDPTNVARLRGTRFAAQGDQVVFPAASISAANRARVANLHRITGLPADVVAEQRAANQALDAGDLMGAWAHSRAADEHALVTIEFTFGRFLAAAKAVVARGRLQGMFVTNILRAMNAAASDSTEGDRALAGAVYVIANEIGSELEHDLLAGKLKVDETTMALPNNALAGYVTAGSGMKGDTIYLPSRFDIDNLAHRAAAAHELQHAADDKAADGPKVRFAAADQAELSGYRMQGRYLLHSVARLSGAARANAITTGASEWNVVVGRATALEARADRARFEPVLRALNAAAPDVRNRLTADEITAALSGSERALVTRLLELIRALNHINAGDNTIVREGLGGESILDWINRERDR